MPKETLSKALEENGFKLTGHYDDSRAGGRHRHKLVIYIQDRDIKEVDALKPVYELVNKFVPEARLWFTPYRAFHFIYYLSPGEKGPAIGTPFYKRISQAYKRRVKKGLPHKTAEEQVRKIYFSK